jgi:hypothetical protein
MGVYSDSQCVCELQHGRGDGRTFICSNPALAPTPELTRAAEEAQRIVSHQKAERRSIPSVTSPAMHDNRSFTRVQRRMTPKFDRWYVSRIELSLEGIPPRRGASIVEVGPSLVKPSYGRAIERRAERTLRCDERDLAHTAADV